MPGAARRAGDGTDGGRGAVSKFVEGRENKGAVGRIIVDDVTVLKVHAGEMSFLEFFKKYRGPIDEAAKSRKKILPLISGSGDFQRIEDLRLPEIRLQSVVFPEAVLLPGAIRGLYAAEIRNTVSILADDAVNIEISGPKVRLPEHVGEAFNIAGPGEDRAKAVTVTFENYDIESKGAVAPFKIGFKAKVIFRGEGDLSSLHAPLFEILEGSTVTFEKPERPDSATPNARAYEPPKKSMRLSQKGLDDLAGEGKIVGLKNVTKIGSPPTQAGPRLTVAT
jgi:hypothetical protein